MKQKENNRQLILTSLFIGLAYLWTGSSYLSWTKHLAPLASSSVTYIATEVGGCITQIIGLLLYSWYVRRDTKAALRPAFITSVMVLDGFSILPVVIAGEADLVLTGGMVMNLFHGAIAGYYIAKLSLCIPQNRRGICFGAGYACGSIGSYLLSRIGPEDFLGTRSVFWVYGGFILLNILLGFYLWRGKNQSAGAKASPDTEETSERRITKDAIPFSSCILAGLVVVCLGLTTQLLFFFPAKAYINDTISLEFVRMFYAVGLIVAALVNDKKRSLGLVLALLSLCFSVLSLSLYQIAFLLSALAILGFIVSGFFSIYRIVVFADLYDNDNRLLFLAPFGLVCGRAGEALGSFLGFVIDSRHIVLSVVTVTLFIATIVLAFLLYIRLYSVSPVTTTQDRENRFFAQFDLSGREQQVFTLLIDGSSNQEIADALYISENTVKFHVKNILRKTDCQKRRDVIRKFQAFP